MTNTELTDQISGAPTEESNPIEVEYFFESYKNPYASVTSRNTSAVYKAAKDLSGYIFYTVSVDKGLLGTELSGKYSTLEKAVEAIKSYLKNKPMTRDTALNLHRQERKERATELRTGGN